MNDKQRAYEAKRRAVTNLQTVPLRTFRIVLDGDDRTERFATMEAAARAYPGAVAIMDCERFGGFY